jgi:hypothetical protein
MPNTTASSEYNTLFTKLLKCSSLDMQLVADLAEILNKQPTAAAECIQKNILQSNATYPPDESRWRFTCATNIFFQISKRHMKYD